MSKMHRSVYVPLCDNPYVSSLLPIHQEHFFFPHRISTPGRRQSKPIDERGSKIARNSVSIAICRQSGDKWQSKTMFQSIFDLRSSIVLMFSIAACML